MFRTINRKFSAIAMALVLLFGLGYAISAFFLHEQHQSIMREQEAMFMKREINSVCTLFFEIRFWDRVVFSQYHPEADKKFGSLMEQIRKRLMVLDNKAVKTDIKENFQNISKALSQYEKDFNSIIQLKTEQRLNRTSMDTSYRSLVSAVLRSGEIRLLKPLFNLTHFQTGYRANRRESEYHALKLVIDYLERKFFLTNFVDDRVKGYLKAFRNLVNQDFLLEQEIKLKNAHFEKISTRLMDLFSVASLRTERLLKNEFEEVNESREKLKLSFLISTILSIIILLLILNVIAKKIIHPIRSMSRVMREIKTESAEARTETRTETRFDPVGNKNDEIIQLGLSFNDMLDTIEKNNQQLINYQEELKKHISELSFRQKKLEENREGLETTVKERTSDLLAANQKLKQEIVERGKTEEERLQLEVQLQQAKKMEAIGTLAGGVAHDLNNILSGIVSYPDLLLMTLPEDSPLREPISTIKASGEKAAVIVQDLLTLARRGVTITEVINLNHIISAQLKSPEFEKLISFHPDVQVESNLETNLLNIKGSSVHLSKTVMNLVSNAAEAMPGGGTISISSENRYIDRPIKGYDYVKEGDYAILSVTDNGIGISREDMEKIFEPFYTKKTMGRSGTGLGMTVVWGTVKDHNGYIDAESTEGKGTTFTLYFPVIRKEINTDKSQAAIEDYMGKGESILIVDDVEEQREIASGMLKRLGYSVKSVSSGEEAVEYLENNSTDLLVLDMIMDPGIDGLETYKRILRLHPGQKAIIASGFSETNRVKEGMKLGVGVYVKKPYTLKKIGFAIKKELEK